MGTKWRGFLPYDANHTYRLGQTHKNRHLYEIKFRDGSTEVGRGYASADDARAAAFDRLAQLTAERGAA